MDNLLNASKILLNGIDTKTRGIYPKGRYEIPTAEEDVEYIHIRGRDGELTRKYGYKNIPFPVRFYIKANSFKTAFRTAKPFLLNAKSIQVDDDEKVFYKIKSVRINPAENIMKTFGEFEVEFILDPFAYELSNEPITISSSTTITNDGYTALPTITATVAGTGKIYIGNQEVTVKDVNGDITIDSTMQNAYQQGSPPINMNKNMVGKFPVLENENNQISFDGDITKLVVVPNRRWR